MLFISFYTCSNAPSTHHTLQIPLFSCIFTYSSFELCMHWLHGFESNAKCWSINCAFLFCTSSINFFFFDSRLLQFSISFAAYRHLCHRRHLRRRHQCRLFWLHRLLPRLPSSCYYFNWSRTNWGTSERAPSFLLLFHRQYILLHLICNYKPEAKIECSSGVRRKMTEKIEFAPKWTNKQNKSRDWENGK